MALEDPASTAAPHDCPATEPAEPSRASPRLVILILISVLAVLPVNMILPSLPGIAASFHVDPATVNLAVAAYAIATAVVEIVCGAMSDRFGRRPVATVSVAVFIGASIGCALAPGIALFLFFRIAQASIDACFSLVLVTIRERSTDRAAASRFGYLGMGWAVAPVLGPIIGGAVDAAFGWRAVFALLAALGAVALGLCRLELERGTPVRSRVDRSYPTAWRSLLCSIRFWSLTLCMMFSMATFYLFLGEAPLILSWAFDAAAPQLGFFMAATPAGFVIGSYLAGRHASRMPLGTTLILARLTTCAGLCAALALSITGAGGMPGFLSPACSSVSATA